MRDLQVSPQVQEGGVLHLTDVALQQVHVLHQGFQLLPVPIGRSSFLSLLSILGTVLPFAGCSLFRTLFFAVHLTIICCITPLDPLPLLVSQRVLLEPHVLI